MLNSQSPTIKHRETEMPSDDTKKRIHNPVTGRYYQIRQRSTCKGEKGTIMGTWSPPKDDDKRKKKR